MEIKAAIYHFCDYQERCHAEVQSKLYTLGCNREEAGQYIAELIEAGLLNEERYARSYARGKFRVLSWGKQKIIQQLKFHKVSAYCIKKAMTEIDEEEYELKLNELARRKWEELRKERSKATRMGKVYRYMLQKGYERELVTDILNNLKGD